MLIEDGSAPQPTFEVAGEDLSLDSLPDAHHALSSQTSDGRRVADMVEDEDELPWGMHASLDSTSMHDRSGLELQDPIEGEISTHS